MHGLRGLDVLLRHRNASVSGPYEACFAIMKEEKASGGLDPVEDAPASTVVERRIYWNFRDNNWIARAQAVDGTWLQATRGIKRKQKASQLDFEEAKKAAFGELEDWVAKVARGEIIRGVNAE